MGRIENKGGIFVQTGRRRLQGVDRGIVDRVDGDGDGVGRGEDATDARISQIAAGNGQGIGAVIIGVRGIDQSRQRCIHLGCRTSYGDTGGSIVGQGGPTDDRCQRPMGHTHRRGKAVHPTRLCRICGIIYRDQVDMGGIEYLGGIFVQTGRCRLQGKDRGIVDRVDGDGDGIDIGQDAPGTGIAKIICGYSECIRPIIVGRRRIDHTIQRRIHLG